MHYINYVLVFTGLAFCTFLILNNRYNTNSKADIGLLVLWVLMWLCLLFADISLASSEIVLQTTIARVVALIINICNFKLMIKNRIKFI